MVSPGPGDWPVDWQAVPAAAALTDEQRAAVHGPAVTLLWALSGRQFGLTLSEFVAPAPQPGCGCGPYPGLVAGRWVNGWPQPGGLRLPPTAHSVRQVVLPDGSVAPPGGWALGQNDTLQRANGDVSPWPAGTRVTYLRGAPVPAGGGQAAAALAAELHAVASGGKCRLPGRVTSIAREGVDVMLVDPSTYAEAGLTGLTEVDRWLRAVNPTGATAAAAVYDPGDAPRHACRPRARVVW